MDSKSLRFALLDAPSMPGPCPVSGGCVHVLGVNIGQGTRVFVCACYRCVCRATGFWCWPCSCRRSAIVRLIPCRRSCPLATSCALGSPPPSVGYTSNTAGYTTLLLRGALRGNPPPPHNFPRYRTHLPFVAGYSSNGEALFRRVPLY